MNTGKQHSFFKSIGVGEARATLNMFRTKSGKTPKGPAKTQEQWWAPARLVLLNNYLLKLGLSSKMRSKAIRCLLEGKELPDRLCDAVTGYTESLLSRD